MLNERGTFESDLTAQRIAENHYRLFVGTNAIKRDLIWLHRYSDGFDVTLTDSTEKYAVLGPTGPEATRIATDTGAAKLNDIGYFKTGPAHIAGKHVRSVRMSYVSKAGWEITCLSDHAPAIYAALTAAGARPADLFAQTSMRIEKGYCAMGHELDGDVTPIEIGLDFATRKSGGFIGAEALAKHRTSGAIPHVISLSFDDLTTIPLGHEPIYINGQIVGQTSSCAFGYRIGKPVALGHVNAQVDNGARVQIDIARELFDATVTIGALYDPSGERMKD